MKGFTLKRALFSALLGLPALLLTFVSPLLMILPGFYAFVAVAWGPVCLGIVVFVSSLCVFLATGLDLVSGLLLLSTYIPATILLSYHLVRRKPWRNAAAWTAAAMGVGLYFLLCLPSLLAGEGPFGEFEAAIATISRQLVDMAGQMGITGAAMSQLEDYVAYLQLAAPELLTITMLGMALAFGFLCVILARGLLLAAGCADQLRPMAPFRSWQLGRSFSFGMLILVMGALVVLLLDLNNSVAMVSAIELLVGAPLALTGLSFIAYLRALRKRGPGYLVLMYGLLVLMLPLSLYMLVILGLLDRLFQFRARNPLP